MSDVRWPCRCDSCAPPLDSCDVCGAAKGVICARFCSEHPSNRAPCSVLAATMAAQPAIEEHW